MPKQKRVTIKDVAALASVSPAVVSRLLNDDPSLVILESTRKRIHQIVSETGYKANPMASGLRRKKTGLIGLVIVDFTNRAAASLRR